MNPDTTAVIRDIFLIVAAGLLAVLCLVLIVVIAKLYRPLIAGVSGETAGNIAQTSRNLVDITEKAKEGTEELSTVIHSARQASDSIAAAASTASRIAEMVSRLIPQASADGGGVSSIGSILRLVRGMFGGRRRDSGGTQQES